MPIAHSGEARTRSWCRTLCSTGMFLIREVGLVAAWCLQIHMGETSSSCLIPFGMGSVHCQQCLVTSTPQLSPCNSFPITQYTPRFPCIKHAGLEKHLMEINLHLSIFCEISGLLRQRMPCLPYSWISLGRRNSVLFCPVGWPQVEVSQGAGLLPSHLMSLHSL